MNGNIVSPNSLWRDFDVELEDIELSVLMKSSADNIYTEKFYFTAMNVEDGKVRVYCELSYSEKAKERFDDKIPVVLLSGDMSSPEIKQMTEKLLSNNYAVICYDFFGLKDEGRYTLYPNSYSFANLDVSKSRLYSVSDSPKNTCWFVWSSITRYLISAVEALEQLDCQRIAILGIGYGANIAYHIAGTDSRINTAVIIGEPAGTGFGYLYENTSVAQTGLFDEDNARFIYSLSSQAYAKLVKKPILVHLNTNVDDSGFDRSMETFSRLPSTLKHGLSVSPYMRQSVGFFQKDNIFKWLDYHLLNEGEFPSLPTVEIYNSEDKLYARLKADTSVPLIGVKIFYGYNTQDAAIRNWHKLTPSTIEDGEYLSRLEVIEDGLNICVYCVATYENGVSVSSKLLQKNIKGMNLTYSNSNSRLIYDAQNGFDCFTITGTTKFFNEERELALPLGPLGLEGLKSCIGNLCTFKLADQRFFGFDNDLLQMTIYSEQPQELTVILHEYKNGRWGRTFYAYDDLTGGEVWQKLNFSAHEFKTPEGVIMNTWEDMALLVIQAESGKELLLRSMLWL